MLSFFVSRALLGDGWAEQVRIEVDAQGMIVSVTPNAAAGDATRLQGALIPAMANLHSHAFQRAMAGLTDMAGDPQDSFWTWREQMYRLVARLTPEQVGVIARQLYITMLKGGYTQVAEFHYLHHAPGGQPYAADEMLHHLLAAATESGIGQTLLPVLYAHAGFGGQPPAAGQRRFIQDTEGYLRQLARLEQIVRGAPLINHGVCFHSLRAVSEPQMREVLAATDASLSVHLHIAEQQREVEECLAWSGQRPVEWLMDRFAVDGRWCLIHATHLSESEITRLARSQAVAGLCPTTEANLGDGIFPATAYLHQQGRWGIGSDSHVSLSVLEELRWLEYAQRLRDQRRNRLHTADNPFVGTVLYTQAAAGGAQACGIAAGTIAPGQRADWLLLADNAWLGECQSEHLLNRWIFAGEKQDIRAVYVAGQPVVVEGRHPLEEQADAAFRQVIRELAA